MVRASAFISYSHLDRAVASQTREVLEGVGMETFLAHDDLGVSDEWRERILEELRRCTLFVPLLSRHFLESKWAPQEAGFIVSRLDEVVIAPLSIDDTVSFGFFSHLHSPRIVPRDGVTRELLVLPLAPRFPRTFIPGLVERAGEASSFRVAERLMGPLVSLFPLFTQEEAQALGEAAVDNGQIWSAGLCRDEYLPEFIKVQGHNLEPLTLRALRYQVEHDERYPREDTNVDKEAEEAFARGWDEAGKD